jgi:hypothetical protein
MDQKEKHARIIGKIFLVLGIMVLVVTSFSFNFIQLTEGFLENHFEGWNFEFGIFTLNHPPFGLLYLIPTFYMLIGLIDIIVGLGLLAQKQWARLAALFSAILFLFQFPLGTGFAIYIFYNLLDHQIVNKISFSSDSPGESKDTPPNSA